MTPHAIKSLLQSYGFTVKSGSDQTMGGPADLYATHDEGYEIIIDDGNINPLLSVAHIYAAGGKIFEGRVENKMEAEVLFKMLGISKLT